MSMHMFLHNHYSREVGESPTAHAMAILAGLMMMAFGLGLALSEPHLPIAIIVGAIGMFVLRAGMFGHMRGPLTIRDLMDTIVGLATMAVSMTFTLAVAAFLVVFAVTVMLQLVEWIRGGV